MVFQHQGWALQLSRGVSAAETCPRAGVDHARHRASIEPRRLRRGNLLTGLERQTRFDTLQLSRGVSAAETPGELEDLGLILGASIEPRRLRRGNRPPSYRAN